MGELNDYDGGGGGRGDKLLWEGIGHGRVVQRFPRIGFIFGNIPSSSGIRINFVLKFK